MHNSNMFRPMHLDLDIQAGQAEMEGGEGGGHVLFHAEFIGCPGIGQIIWNRTFSNSVKRWGSFAGRSARKWRRKKNQIGWMID